MPKLLERKVPSFNFQEFDTLLGDLQKLGKERGFKNKIQSIELGSLKNATLQDPFKDASPKLPDTIINATTPKRRLRGFLSANQNIASNGRTKNSKNACSDRYNLDLGAYIESPQQPILLVERNPEDNNSDHKSFKLPNPEPVPNLTKKSVLSKIVTPKRNADFIPSCSKATNIETPMKKSTEEYQEQYQTRETRLEVSKIKREAQIAKRKEDIIAHIAQEEQQQVNNLKMKELRESRRMWEGLIPLVSRIGILFQLISVSAQEIRYHKSLCHAAMTIQRQYKNMILIRLFRYAQSVKNKLKGVRWRIMLWMRCTRRKVHANLLRQFLVDFLPYTFEYVMVRHRKEVIQAQGLMKDFLLCKRAREIVLEKLWKKLEKKARDEATWKGSNVVAGPSLARQRIDLLSKKVIETMALGQTDQNLVTVVSDDSAFFRRKLCRFHLEDERLRHEEEAVRKMKGMKYQPDHLDIEDAKRLIAGQHIDIWALKHKWPPFLFYSKGKTRFKSVVQTWLSDENLTKENVRARLRKEKGIIPSDEVVEVRSRDENNEVEISKDINEPDLKTNDTKTGIGDSKIGSQPSAQLLASRETINDMNAKDLEVLREVFNLVDTDKGGTINAAELEQMFAYVGISMDKKELYELITKTSGRSSDAFTFQEFVRSVRTRMAPKLKYTEKRMMQAFATFSKEKMRNIIYRSELINALTSYNGKWGEFQAKRSIFDAGLSKITIDYKSYIEEMFEMHHADVCRSNGS